MEPCDEYAQSLEDMRSKGAAATEGDWREQTNKYVACTYGSTGVSVDENAAATDIVTEVFGTSQPANQGIETRVREQLVALGEGKESPSNEPAQPEHWGADPVMLASGQFVHEVTDIAINGAGIDFVFSRTYKNQVPFNGPLGFNWTHNFHVWLREASDVIFRSTGDLREEAFTRHPRYGEGITDDFDYWMPPDGRHEVIFTNDDSFTLRLTDGRRYVFERDSMHAFLHRLRRIEDRHGNYLELVYQESQIRNVEINHPRRFVDFEYDELGRIRMARDHQGRLWRYTYDSFGDLIAVTSPPTDRYRQGCTVAYEYSSGSYTDELQHNLTCVIDAAGQVYVQNEYGSAASMLDFNRVVRQRQGGGEFIFEYDDFSGELDFDYPDIERPAQQTILIQRNAQPVRHVYNEFGNLLLREQQVMDSGLIRTLAERYHYNVDGQVIGSLSAEGVLAQHLYGRDYFSREHGLTPNGSVDPNPLTWQIRQGFGRVLSSVRRALFFRFPDFQLPLGDWGGFPDILTGFLPDDRDIIVKNTYEPTYGQLRTVSDPRFTTSADPDAVNEHPLYQGTLTENIYEGPAGDPGRFLVEIRRPAATLPDGTSDGPVRERFREADGTPGYDMRGRLLRHVTPAGRLDVFTYYPPTPNDPREGYLQRRVVDPGDLALTTEYDVDPLGRAIAVRLPRSVEVEDDRFVVRTTFNELDQPIETTTSLPFEYKTRSYYDLNGLLERFERDTRDDIGTAQADGPEVHTYKYDQESNLIRDAIGGADAAAHFVTRHRYNSAGKRALTILPNGNQVRYTYDERLLPVTTTWGACSDNEISTHIEYDDDGRMRRAFDARGNATDYRLDPFGRVVAIQNSLGHVTRQDYDKLGNLTCARQFERQADGSYRLLARVETEYDELGRPIRSGINRFDHPPEVAQAASLDTAFLVTPGPGELVITETYHDLEGRVVRSVDALRRVATIEYDQVGRVLSQTDHLGNRIENRYDAHGNTIRQDQHDLVRDQASGATIGERVFSTTSKFDELDRVVESIDSLGNMTQYAYDSRGNRSRRIDALGNVSMARYDIYNRRVATLREQTETGLGGGAWREPAVTQFEYDRNGNLVALVDALGRRTRYIFDSLDRRRAVVYTDNGRASFDYDPDGNVVQVRDCNGLRRLYTVDVLGRTIRADVDRSGLADGVEVEGAGFELYEYDGLGRQHHAENDYVRNEVLFNSLGWPLLETVTFTVNEDPLVMPLVIAREFSNVGEMVALTYPSGRRLQFHRDDLDRLTRIQNLAKGTAYPGDLATPEVHDIVTMEYAGRQRIRCGLGNSATTNYAHDGAGRLIEIAHGSANGSVLTLQYLLDAVGNIRLRNDIDPKGNLGETLAYNSFYRLANQTPANLTPFNPASLAPASALPPDPIPNRQVAIDNLIGPLALSHAPVTFEYDLVGNRTREMLANGTGIAYGVNPLDQYTVRDANEFGYDQNGNLIIDNDRRYVYDSMNRLVRAADRLTGATIARFFHDARGRRVLESRNGSATHLVWDANNVIAEYQGGMPTALYVYDEGLDRPLQIAAEGADHWYHLDRVGSVRLITDRAGNPAALYRYTPFGLPDPTPPAGPYNPLRFTARRLDEQLGTYDYRARQYDPVLGRFLQRDSRSPIDGSNLYTYAMDAPMGWTDPLGTEARPETEQAAITAYFQENRNALDKMARRYSLIPESHQAFDVYRYILDEIESSASSGRPIDVRGLWSKAHKYNWDFETRAWMSTCMDCQNKPSFEDSGFGSVAGVDTDALFWAAISRNVPNPTWIERNLQGILTGVLVAGITVGPSLAEGGILGTVESEAWTEAAFANPQAIISEAAQEGPSGSWAGFARSRAEADAFRQTMEQVQGRQPLPPPKLGGGPGKWGSTFRNDSLQPGRTPELPPGLGPFQEYTTLLPGQVERGGLRTVTGKEGAVFRTWTHYGKWQPYFPVDPAEPLPRTTFLRAR